jgi:hypothetical protein
VGVWLEKFSFLDESDNRSKLMAQKHAPPIPPSAENHLNLAVILTTPNPAGEHEKNPFPERVPGPFQGTIESLRRLAKLTMAVSSKRMDNPIELAKIGVEDGLLCELAQNVSTLADRGATQWTRMTEILNTPTPSGDVDLEDVVLAFAKLHELSLLAEVCTAECTALYRSAKKATTKVACDSLATFISSLSELLAVNAGSSSRKKRNDSDRRSLAALFRPQRAARG